MVLKEPKTDAMILRRRPMTTRDIPEITEIIASHPVLGPRYGTGIVDLQRAWQRVLGCDALGTAIIQAGDGPRAPICYFGVSVFVSDDFVREIKTPPLFWFGPELARRILRGRSPLLTDRQVREANSGAGMNLICWESCVRPGFEKYNEVHRMIMSVFLEAHAGFRWKEVINSQVDSAERLVWAMKTGGLLWDPPSGRYVETLENEAREIVQEPHLIGVTREMELARPGSWAGSWVGAMFDHRLPRCGFSRGEQRMLMLALEGGTDQDLSKELGISLPTVKKAWLSVYRRVTENLPELNLDDSQAADTPSEVRGKEKKRRLLAYVREHFEELRPFSPRLVRPQAVAAH